MARIGSRTHRVIIKQKSVTRSARQAEQITWSTVATVWASIAPTTGREAFAAQQEYARVSAIINIWYRSGITPEMRVYYGSRVFNVKAVIDPDEMKRELNLICEEEVS